ncbi:hypothetical protein K432DRAFT_159978 [Lepidopterella palustris CBS 459.81]|uniref:Uncharacterized protein n=1 Tax=Lepidopterella palustris CBS 459.81 TaxID=1314670 RepID=A0A8E2E257_9PEZI|nr:hypothetical protein K432DRAFT_159978 [Lepidopterella palustris CBS 459.81]
MAIRSTLTGQRIGFSRLSRLTQSYTVREDALVLSETVSIERNSAIWRESYPLPDNSTNSLEGLLSANEEHLAQVQNNGVSIPIHSSSPTLARPTKQTLNPQGGLNASNSGKYLESEHRIGQFVQNDNLARAPTGTIETSLAYYEDATQSYQYPAAGTIRTDRSQYPQGSLNLTQNPATTNDIPVTNPPWELFVPIPTAPTSSAPIPTTPIPNPPWDLFVPIPTPIPTNFPLDLFAPIPTAQSLPDGAETGVY